jgi:hypothetical protein
LNRFTSLPLAPRGAHTRKLVRKKKSAAAAPRGDFIGFCAEIVCGASYLL